ncbi:MAG TPA: helix-turn-helix transcriptional regulator [Turneriella sp.]|nr:helix-turn-helix transcriptional regulator [Turneriella sp.]HMY10215.1 helix-turn-helix transcriptional regulator [Turneriella sp.]HNA78670.1 helix-turn-helix transcriptional regulator [Turneriella sp.]HNE20526.1 helix-turn-helix transcriptional regulator [Turneriella sp.]HNL09511.1 helix-turn-helix transcriptional regulator [Turneriella sp.]
MGKLNVVTAKNPKELFEAIGLTECEAADAIFRAKLNSDISSLFGKSKLTHEALAKKVGTSRTRITALLNRSRSDISTDFMLKVLAALGYTVEPRLKKIA